MYFNVNEVKQGNTKKPKRECFHSSNFSLIVATEFLTKQYVASRGLSATVGPSNTQHMLTEMKG